LGGHGLGYCVHEDPMVFNYGKAGTGVELVAGMVLAFEPMFTLGREEVRLDPDGWTVRTVDGSRAAQFEHTILITDGPAEVITRREDG
jgi:methionyl aminopeptidase